MFSLLIPFHTFYTIWVWDLKNDVINSNLWYSTNLVKFIEAILVRIGQVISKFTPGKYRGHSFIYCREYYYIFNKTLWKKLYLQICELEMFLRPLVPGSEKYVCKTWSRWSKTVDLHERHPIYDTYLILYNRYTKVFLLNII